MIVNNVYAECFSHIPYAHNNKYTHLPQNEKFCVKNKSGKINFKISEIYSRIIFEKNAQENIHFAFGDSQLLGIDWDETKKFKHDLQRLLNNKNISIFASPNNGPFQTLAQAKHILKNNKFKNLKKIIFSFNFGNDIFRVQKHWKLENFVPLKSNDLDVIIRRPFLYDLVILRGVLSGKFFSTNLPNISETYLQYKQLNKYTSKNRIDIWLNEIKKLRISLKKHFILIMYPPYWIYSKKGEIIYKDVYNDYNELYIYISSKKVFDEIKFGKLYTKKYLTFDERHFKTGSISFGKK